MPIAQTSACLTLSVLNDAGYMAFCESDFVVIPAGILLAQISGRPQFLNDPTYPHDGRDHAGPLHGAAADGWPDPGCRPAS